MQSSCIYPTSSITSMSGLDIIYIQAKRWAGAVGRPGVQKFAGALQGQRAKKGVMITTSSFTPDCTTSAGEFAAFGCGAKIMLTIMVRFVIAGWDLIQGAKCINTDLNVVISIGYESNRQVVGKQCLLLAERGSAAN